MFTRRTIKAVVLTARGRSGETYAVVTYTDGGYGIARDGEPIQGYYWQGTDGEMEECAEALRRLTGLDQDDSPAATRVE